MKNRMLEMIRRLSGISEPADQQISVFGQMSEPEHVCYTIGMVDVSGSMKSTDIKPSRIEAAKKSYLEFILTRKGLGCKDKVAIIAFDNTARVVLEFTDLRSTDEIVKAISSLRAGGGTCLKAAFERALSFLRRQRLEVSHGCLVRILLLTDGHGGDPVKVAAKLKSAGVLIEIIGIGGKPSDVNEAVLKKAATTDAGGFNHYWFIKDSASMVEHYRDLATGIVSYDSDDD